MTGDVGMILCCPKCRSTLDCRKGAYYCDVCGTSAAIEGRLIDFSQMVPSPGFDLAESLQQLSDEAGHFMEDVEQDWRIARVLQSIKENVRGSVCLEIGGADGPMTPFLERLFKVVLSIDYSKAFLKRIESKTDNAICLFGDALFLPLQDQSVDCIVCSEVLEHVTVPTQLLTEMRRVVKKGGVVILSVPNESVLRFLGTRKSKQGSAYDTHVNFYTPDTLEKLLFRTGFRIESIRTILRPNRNLRALIKNCITYVSNGFYGPYILCVLGVMENPLIYWQSFYKNIQKKEKT